MLTGPPEARLEMRIAGYKHAAGATNDFDANWVVVEVAARDGETEWTASGPAFLTWEVLELIGWLRDVSGGVDDGRGFSGMEGALQFEAADLDGKPALTAIFTERLAPDVHSSADEYAVGFRPTAEDIRAFADSLAAQMAGVPIRVVEKDGYASKLLGRGG